jgi:hypothetical protein
MQKQKLACTSRAQNISKNQSEEPRPEKKKEPISVLNFKSLVCAFCYLLLPNAAGIDQLRRQETGRSSGL